MTSSFHVRRADVDDARGIASLHVRAWLAAYRGLVADPLLDGLDVEEHTLRTRDRLESPERETWVALDGGSDPEVIVGFGVLLPARDDDIAPGTGEVAAMYVDPDRWRTGAGARLMRAMEARANAQGYRELMLWVLRDNTGARAFYERQGFKFDGTEAVEARLGDPPPVKVRYRRTLQSEPRRNGPR